MRGIPSAKPSRTSVGGTWPRSGRGHYHSLGRPIGGAYGCDLQACMSLSRPWEVDFFAPPQRVCYRICATRGGRSQRCSLGPLPGVLPVVFHGTVHGVVLSTARRPVLVHVRRYSRRSIGPWFRSKTPKPPTKTAPKPPKALNWAPSPLNRGSGAVSAAIHSAGCLL